MKSPCCRSPRPRPPAPPRPAHVRAPLHARATEFVGAADSPAACTAASRATVVEREHLAHLLFAACARGSPPLGFRPASFSRPRSRLAAGRSGPVRAARAISTVDAPIPGIARSLFQPRSRGWYHDLDAPARRPRARPFAGNRLRACEVTRFELCRCRPAQRRRRRQVSQPARPRLRFAARPAPPQARHQPALDRCGAVVVDQLLAHRPHQRLERLGPASAPEATAACAASLRSAGRLRNACRTRADRRPRPARTASERSHARRSACSARAPRTRPRPVRSAPRARPPAPRACRAAAVRSRPAPARHPVLAQHPRQPEGARRPDLYAQLHRSLACSALGAAQQVDVHQQRPRPRICTQLAPCAATLAGARRADLCPPALAPPVSRAGGLPGR